MLPDSLVAKAALLIVCSSLCLAVAQPRSWAAPEGEAEAAPAPIVDPAKAFSEALELWEAGDYAAALPLFRQATGTTGSPNARLYIARCLRDLGNLPEAYEEMSRTLHDAMVKAREQPRYAQTRDTAAAELALLERKVGKVVVALHRSLAGAEVTINNVPLEPGRLGQPVPVSPGRITIVASGTDGKSAQRDVTVAAGTTVSVALAVGMAPEPVTTQTSPPPPQPTEPPDEGEGFGLLRGVGIGVAAVGVGGLILFAVGRAKTDAEFATLEEECGAGPCTEPAYQDVIDRGRTWETVSWIGLGVGAAGVLAGAALIIFGGPSGNDTEAAWSATPDGIRVRF